MTMKRPVSARYARYFADGGLMPFGPQDEEFPDVQVAQAPPAQPAPAPAPAINTAPPAARGVPATPQGRGLSEGWAIRPTPTPPQLNPDELTLNRAREEDAQLLGRRVSHQGFHDPVRGPPAAFNLQKAREADPEWQNWLAGDEWLKQNGKTLTRADFNTAMRNQDRILRGIDKRANDEWKRVNALYKTQQSKEMRDIEGLREGASTLDEQYGKALTLRQQMNAASQAKRDTANTKESRLDAERLYLTDVASDDPDERKQNRPLLTPDNFKMLAVELQRKNALPLERAGSELVNMARAVWSDPELPNAAQPFNKRRGPAAANYVILGQDEDANVVVQTPTSTLRVPLGMFQQIEAARIAGYYKMQDYMKKFRAGEAQQQQPGWLTRQIDRLVNPTR